MKNIAIALLVVSVGVLGVLAYSQAAALRQQREQVRQLNAKLEESASKSATFDRQEKCATQARVEFNSQGKAGELSGFTNHYSEKLNRCFMVVQDTNSKIARGHIIQTKFLFDAFEGKDYGQFFWKSDGTKKYSEVLPFVCEVTLPSGEKRICHSSDEFEELIKFYME
jgi:hypothetical protein